MKFGPYVLLKQTGVGGDGITYLARDERDGAQVEIRRLAGVRENLERWKWLQRGLRQVARIQRAAVLRIRDLQLEGAAPFVVVEQAGRSLTEVGHLEAWSTDDVLSLAQDLADGLAEAHRLGVVHGSLCPATIQLTAEGCPRIDLCGTDTGARPPLQGQALAYQAPELTHGFPVPASDVYSLGVLMAVLLTGEEPAKAVSGALEELTVVPGAGSGEAGAARASISAGIARMLQLEPEARPSMRTVHRWLLEWRGEGEGTTEGGLADDEPSLLESSQIDASAPEAPAPSGPPKPAPARASITLPMTLGRFRLLEMLGSGASGKVYLAEDLADGRRVAVKALREELSGVPEVVRRFQREARLLSALDNPYVAGMIEANEDQGIHYLAMELLDGTPLDAVLRERTRLEETEALQIMCDVARGLSDAHDLGIVHRDIKPANILLVRLDGKGSSSAPVSGYEKGGVGVKLVDFGVARRIDAEESVELTQAGALVGTPSYMAPEQCRGGKIDCRTDIYAMGATLYRLLAGVPPFQGPDPVSVISMHLGEVATPLNRVRPELSDGVTRLVARMLEKAPDRRFAHAGELLEELERLLRGETERMESHPKMPDSKGEDVLTYAFRWELASSPDALWPHITNTDRLNRAIGLNAVEFSPGSVPDERERQAHIRLSGMDLQWLEHPFEWIEGQRFGVLREFSSGPFKWFRNIVELSPRKGGGTELSHTIQVLPNGVLGRAAAAAEIGFKARRSLAQVYQRIDQVVSARLEAARAAAPGGSAVAVPAQTRLADPFEEAARLTTEQRKRLEQQCQQLIQRGCDAEVVECLELFLQHSPAPEVGRIRPLAFAKRFRLSPDAVVRTFLHAARDGVLVLLWDLMCPVCRVSAGLLETLKALRNHGHCQACNLDFKLDFAGSMEMIFRVHPQIRSADTGTYCIGGPAHRPHVVAQVRVAAGERFELGLTLTAGRYRIAGPQLPTAATFRVSAGGTTSRLELVFRPGGGQQPSPVLRAGHQDIALANDFDEEILVRVERTTERDDAFTAALAACLPLFRELFPQEILSPGYLVSVASISLLVTRIDEAGLSVDLLDDSRSYSLLHEHFRTLSRRIEREGGAVVKILGEGLLACFPDPASAVRAGFGVVASAEGTAKGGIPVRAGVHTGTAMAVTLNDRLDYFGRTVRLVSRLADLGRGGELLLSEAVARDPGVIALLEKERAAIELLEGPDAQPVQRVRSDGRWLESPPLRAEAR